MKIFKKVAALVTVAAMVTLSMTAFAQEPQVGDDYDAENGAYESYEMDALPVFMSFTGEVVSIEPFMEDDEPVEGEYFIKVEGEDGPAVFRQDWLTFVLGDEIAVGDTITGYYEAGLPMIMIFPPQFPVRVIVNGEFTNLAVDRFDEELVSFDGSLQLNIGDDTEIILQSGADFDGELTNRMLVVVYDISTRSIPAITTPSLIVVLYERAVALPGVDFGGALIFDLDENGEEYDADEVDEIDWSMYNVIVNGQGLANVSVATIGDYIFPTHVQLRPVLEAFGITPSWNGQTREVSFTNINGEDVVFRVGTATVTVGDVVVTMHQNTVIIDNSTYAPLGFFRAALGVNNAYFSGGHVFINNDELVE